jgi:hypothetical protein
MKIYAKIAAAKEAIGTIQKTALNPFAKAKYAPLSEILKVANKALHENNLYLELQCRINDNNSNLYTFFVSIYDTETSEKAESSFDIPFDTTQKNPVQGFGAMTTYAQRYIYGILFGIPFDNEDPDAQKDEPKKQADIRKPAPAPVKPKVKIELGTETYNKAFEAVRSGKYTLLQLEAWYVITDEVKQSIINQIAEIDTAPIN